MKENLTDYEPNPLPNDGKSMHDLVIEDLVKDERYFANFLSTPRTLDTLKKDLIERKDFGFKKYGTILQAHNGRNPYVDAYQEIQDLLVYLRQVIEENGESYKVKGIYDTILLQALMLRELL